MTDMQAVDGCPFPRMMSVMIALDAATWANGCLEVPAQRAVAVTPR